MSPASKQFEEHIASGAFVRPGRRRWWWWGGGGGGVAGEGYFLYEELHWDLPLE